MLIKSADGYGEAEFSDCGTYRYVLRRRNPIPLRWVRSILFVMLNPSTADEVKNDPTIRRCIYFAGRLGGSELTIVNLFALRSTDPKKLLTHPEPVGPLNDAAIEREIDKAAVIVLAWGAHKAAKQRGKQLLESIDYQTMFRVQCLGTSRDGSPRHPLYIKKDQPFLSGDLCGISKG